MYIKGAIFFYSSKPQSLSLGRVDTTLCECLVPFPLKMKDKLVDTMITVQTLSETRYKLSFWQIIKKDWSSRCFGCWEGYIYGPICDLGRFFPSKGQKWCRVTMLKEITGWPDIVTCFWIHLPSQWWRYQ